MPSCFFNYVLDDAPRLRLGGGNATSLGVASGAVVAVDTIVLSSPPAVVAAATATLRFAMLLNASAPLNSSLVPSHSLNATVQVRSSLMAAFTDVRTLAGFNATDGSWTVTSLPTGLVYVEARTVVNGTVDDTPCVRYRAG